VDVEILEVEEFLIEILRGQSVLRMCPSCVVMTIPANSLDRGTRHANRKGHYLLNLTG